MINKHDRLLLKDLKLQPLWLLWFYIILGVLAGAIGFILEEGILSKIACFGGGFLICLGAEKLVTRRIRRVALSLLDKND
jgi:H+/Cl- antiporter ClcA